MEVKSYSKKEFISKQVEITFDNGVKQDLFFNQNVIGQSLIIQSNSGFTFVFPFPLNIDTEKFVDDNVQSNKNTFEQLCSNNDFQVFKNHMLVSVFRNSNRKNKQMIALNKNGLVLTRKECVMEK